MVEELRTVSTPQGMIQYLLAVKKVKNMNLRVRPDGSVHVSVSRRVPKTAADDFVRSRANWIAARLAERAAGPGPWRRRTGKRRCLCCGPRWSVCGRWWSLWG